MNFMKNKKLSLLAAAAALSLLTTQGALAQKKYDTGASDTEIKIGNVEAYSGPASAYGVIGIPDEQWGEVGMAIVALKPGHALAAAEIHAHCAANLARFKCPRLIEFVDALPRNATGKIHKPTLRKNFSTPKATDTNAIAS